jgi:hypothetical protein
MKRSPLMRMAVLVGLEERAFFNGVGWLEPVRLHSLTPRSNRSGEAFGAAMFDFVDDGDDRLDDRFEDDRESDAKVSCKDPRGAFGYFFLSACHSGSRRDGGGGGVKGEWLADALVRGEGVRGTRPPA